MPEYRWFGDQIKEWAIAQISQFRERRRLPEINNDELLEKYAELLRYFPYLQDLLRLARDANNHTHFLQALDRGYFTEGQLAGIEEVSKLLTSGGLLITPQQTENTLAEDVNTTYLGWYDAVPELQDPSIIYLGRVSSSWMGYSEERFRGHSPKAHLKAHGYELRDLKDKCGFRQWGESRIDYAKVFHVSLVPPRAMRGEDETYSYVPDHAFYALAGMAGRIAWGREIEDSDRAAALYFPQPVIPPDMHSVYEAYLAHYFEFVPVIESAYSDSGRELNIYERELTAGTRMLAPLLSDLNMRLDFDRD